jgi:hypothetical protein
LLLVVDERQQLRGGGVALLDGGQDAGDVAEAPQCGLEVDDVLFGPLDFCPGAAQAVLRL